MAETMRDVDVLDTGGAANGRLARWTPFFLLGSGLALLPWTFYLTAMLPARHDSQHWGIAWVGFDLALASVLITTAIAAVRRSPWIEGAAMAAGTLLLCDVWFDVLMSKPGSELLEAVLQAAVGEIPLAVFCFWIARSAERFFSRTDGLRR